MTTLTQPVATKAEIQFGEGIIGIPGARRFVLLTCEDSPVRVLQCLDIEGFNLPVVDPFLADPDYRPQLGNRISETLELAEKQDVLLLAITRLQKPGPHLANLRAPLVINASTRKGLQVILDHGDYSLEAPVHLADSR